jgi:flavin-binding protein dodecin
MISRNLQPLPTWPADAATCALPTRPSSGSLTEAAQTVRGMKWGRVAELEMELDGKKVVQYRTTAKIYFDIEK